MCSIFRQASQEIIGFHSCRVKEDGKMAYIMFAVMLLMLLGTYLFFLIRRLLKFYGADVKKKGILAVNIVLAATTAFFCLNLFRTSSVMLLHTVIFFFLTDVAAFLVRKLYRKKEYGRAYTVCRTFYQCGIIPVLLTAVVFVYGWLNMNQIRQTYYQVKTEKEIGEYRIALLTDIHYDSVQDTEVLKEKMNEVNQQDPDIIILGGDIVEESTSKEKMQEVFQMLGSLNNKYGVYYVYGNHDRQPYTNHRTYTDVELVQAIEAGGIQILEDSYTEIGEDIILAGRGDAAWGATKQRASSKEILLGADRKKYIIMADHQPIEAAENAAQGVDLELSGHTHAGQIWPMGLVSEFMGALNYGMYQEGDCKIIVSSGAAGWAYTVRTGEHCEYVLIDLMNEKIS